MERHSTTDIVTIVAMELVQEIDKRGNAIKETEIPTMRSSGDFPFAVLYPVDVLMQAIDMLESRRMLPFVTYALPTMPEREKTIFFPTNTIITERATWLCVPSRKYRSGKVKHYIQATWGFLCTNIGEPHVENQAPHPTLGVARRACVDLR